MHQMPSQLWVYRASWDRVIDGATVEVRVDAGFRNYCLKRLRLLGVHAPAMHGVTLDAAARTFVVRWLETAEAGAGDDQWPLVIQTSKPDASGCFLSLVWRTCDQRSLNQDLLDAVHAAEVLR